jgi:activator of 2-hydroxyglutaryl-CoA dehydratase
MVCRLGCGRFLPTAARRRVLEVDDTGDVSLVMSVKKKIASSFGAS